MRKDLGNLLVGELGVGCDVIGRGDGGVEGGEDVGGVIRVF